MGRIAAFEGLRGIMAGWVMLFHIAAFSAMPFANAMHSGVPVDVFILISGFVITHLVNSRSEAYGQFILRRFMRLYPIYLVALLVAVGLTDVYRYLIFDSSLAPFMETQQIRQEDVDRNFILHILLHLTMMHGVLPDQVLPASSLALLSPAWSITLEWQFYLIAPFLLARIRGRRAFLVAFALAYLGFWIVRLSGLDFGKPSFLLQRLPHFLVGIGAYLFYFKLLQDGRATRLMWRRMILWGSIAALALASFAVVLGIIFMAMVTWPTGMRGERLAKRLTGVLSTRPFVAVGSASYSLYILHVPVIWLVLYFLLPLVEPNRYYLFMIMVVIVPIITITLSLQTYRYIEQPMMRWRSQRKHRAA